MVRFIACLLALGWLGKAVDCNTLDNIFASPASNTIESLKCNKIEAEDGNEWYGCYDCYTCDHPRYKHHLETRSNTRRLTVENNNCKPIEVCCVQQTDITSARTQHNCGKSNPEGQPRSVRPTLRNVLPGQFPWRAWVYLEDTKGCPATYIHSYPDVLVTTATCMSWLMSISNDSTVRFDKDLGVTTSVSSVRIHPKFNFFENDIALLKLESKPAKTARPICRTEVAAEVGTPCVAVSEDDVKIQATVPEQKRYCNATEGTMCAVVPRNDFIPEMASGLYCLDTRHQDEKYLLHGIMIGNDEHIIQYTQLSFYDKWIHDEIKSML